MAADLHQLVEAIYSLYIIPPACLSRRVEFDNDATGDSFAYRISFGGKRFTIDEFDRCLETGRRFEFNKPNGHWVPQNFPQGALAVAWEARFRETYGRLKTISLGLNAKDSCSDNAS